MATYERNKRPTTTKINETVAEFAKEVEVAPRTVKAWEAGRQSPKILTLIKISKLFGVRIDYLVGRSEVKYY